MNKIKEFFKFDYTNTVLSCYLIGYFGANIANCLGFSGAVAVSLLGMILVGSVLKAYTREQLK